MPRRTLFAALLLLAGACGPAATEPQPATPAGAVRDGNPPPDTTPTVENDTTRRGGGTIGSGT